ncbi:MAG: alpha-L-fucosidase, partial [Planctomycetota bacterium]
SWGYKKNDHNWKSTEKLLHNLVDTASKGGNYLLNVGPTCEGLIPKASIERLQAIGKWLKVNGESIYGTTASPIGKPVWGRCTARPGKLYLHVFDWPADGKLEVPELKNKINEAYLLAEGTCKLDVRQEEDKALIDLPDMAFDEIDTVIVLAI